MKKRFFFIAFFIYFIILFSKKTGLFFPEVINSYLSDLICIPVVLTFCLWIIRWIKNDKNIYFTIPMIGMVVLMFSVFFEFHLPKTSDKYTGDYLDVVMYIIGGIIYCFLQEKNDLHKCDTQNV